MQFTDFANNLGCSKSFRPDLEKQRTLDLSRNETRSIKLGTCKPSLQHNQPNLRRSLIFFLCGFNSWEEAHKDKYSMEEKIEIIRILHRLAAATEQSSRRVSQASQGNG